MKILDEFILYENKNFYPAFPSIIGFEKNKYLISFRLAPKSEKNYSHLHSLSKAIVSTVHKNKIINTIWNFFINSNKKLSKNFSY